MTRAPPATPLQFVAKPRNKARSGFSGCGGPHLQANFGHQFLIGVTAQIGPDFRPATRPPRKGIHHRGAEHSKVGNGLKLGREVDPERHVTPGAPRPANGERPYLTLLAKNRRSGLAIPSCASISCISRSPARAVASSTSKTAAMVSSSASFIDPILSQ